LELRSASSCSCQWSLFAWGVGIRHTFDVHDQGDTSEYPLVWVDLGLQLSGEDVGGTTSNGHVDWARVDTLILLAFWGERNRAAVHDWQDTEWLLGEALLELTDGWVPSGTLDLQSKDIGTLLDWWKIGLPIEFLEHVRLDVQLVQLGLLLLGVHLLGGSQERLWVEQSVDECHSWDVLWVLLPKVQLIETVLQVVQP